MLELQAQVCASAKGWVKEWVRPKSDSTARHGGRFAKQIGVSRLSDDGCGQMAASAESAQRANLLKKRLVAMGGLHIWI